jgi:hypothetical protein
MTDCRRRALLSLAFLTAAACLATPPGARGQDRRPSGPGRAANESASQEQSIPPQRVKDVLRKLGGEFSDGDDLAELIRRVQQMNPRLNPELVESITRDWMTDPAKRALIEKMVEQGHRTGEVPSLADIAKQLPGIKAQGAAPKIPNDFRLPPDLKLPPLEPGQPRPGSLPAPGPGLTRPPSRVLPPPPPPVGSGPPDMPPQTGTGPIPGRGAQPGPNLPDAQPHTMDPGGPAALTGPGLNTSSLPDTDLDRRRRAFQIASAFWERNFGPIDDTPAVKRALADLINGTADMKGPDGKNFWETLARDAGDGSSLAEWLKNGGPGGDWKLPSFELGSTGLGRWWSGTGRVGGSSGSSGWSAPRPSGSGSRVLGIPGLEGSWLPVVLLGAILIGALVWWRFWYLRDPGPVGMDLPDGLGPWPVDPAAINSREDVVKAFEYLSVLICGPAARTWTHGTIAEALTALAATHEEPAAMLARLYELARYAPRDEPLSADELAEARRLVCRLAGVRQA